MCLGHSHMVSPSLLHPILVRQRSWVEHTCVACSWLVRHQTKGSSRLVYRSCSSRYTSGVATTIKLSASTRDRVNAVGARTGQTADQVVGRAIDEYERALFWQAYAAAADAVAADPQAAADVRAEQDLWDRTVRDGLERD